MFIPPLSWGIQKLQRVRDTPLNFLRFHFHYLVEVSRNTHCFYIQPNALSIKMEWFILDQGIFRSQNKSSEGLTDDPTAPWKIVKSKQLLCAKKCITSRSTPAPCQSFHRIHWSPTGKHTRCYKSCLPTRDQYSTLNSPRWIDISLSITKSLLLVWKQGSSSISPLSGKKFKVAV